jgi:hypothetical protein
MSAVPATPQTPNKRHHHVASTKGYSTVHQVTSIGSFITRKGQIYRSELQCVAFGCNVQQTTGIA